MVANVLINFGWDLMKNVKGIAFWNFKPHMVLWNRQALAKDFRPECVPYFFKKKILPNPVKIRSTPKITLRVCYDLRKS